MQTRRKKYDIVEPERKRKLSKISIKEKKNTKSI